MELSTKKSELFRWHTVCDTVSEIGVESDIVLPDYCADIERILKCTLTARVASKRLEAGRLTISGTAFLRMVYLTSEGNIGSFETQIPFSKNCEIAQAESDCFVNVRVKSEYVNCRALSARRFEVRSSLSAKICVKCRKAVQIISDIEGDGVEVKKRSRDVVVPVDCVCENFTVMEEYEISGAPISSVIRMTASPNVTDSKIVSGKLILKGEIAVCIVYMPQESDEIKTANFKVPVNHIMTAHGAEEEDTARVAIEIVRMSAEPVNRGDVSEIALEIFLEACADISRKQQIEMVSDAYCMGFDSQAEIENIDVTSFESVLCKNYSLTVSPEADFSEILDVFPEIVSCTASSNEQGEVMADVNMNVAFLLKNSEGVPFVSENPVNAQFSLGADRDFKNTVCDLYVSVAAAQITSNKRGADIELSAECKLCKKEEIACVNAFEVDENMPKARGGKTAFTLYFADEGEDVFDIAKRYNTSARAVMKENSLEDSLINFERAILIPRM